MAIDYERNIEGIVAVFDCQDSGNERMMTMLVGGDNMRKMRRNTCIQRVLLEQAEIEVRMTFV